MEKKQEEILKEEVQDINNSKQNEEIQNNNEDNKTKEEVEKLKALITELDGKVKYNQAELINYRRRKDEEVNNMLKYANQDLLLDLIPIADNFERAIKLDDQNLTDELSKFLAGFKMIYSHLNELLKKYEVEEIPSVGEAFDPQKHEALMTTKDEKVSDDVVVECLLKGYTLKGKVIRPAKVIVNKL